MATSPPSPLWLAYRQVGDRKVKLIVFGLKFIHQFHHWASERKRQKQGSEWQTRRGSLRMSGPAWAGRPTPGPGTPRRHCAPQGSRGPAGSAGSSRAGRRPGCRKCSRPATGTQRAAPAAAWALRAGSPGDPARLPAGPAPGTCCPVLGSHGDVAAACLAQPRTADLCARHGMGRCGEGRPCDNYNRLQTPPTAPVGPQLRNPNLRALIYMSQT